MKKLIVLMSILMGLGCKGQTTSTPCNKKTKYESRKAIPQVVCIPNGYVIAYIDKPADLNNDGLNDFICSYQKEKLADGDSIFVAIYFQRNDSSYYLAKTLPNIYPIFFEDYSIERYKRLTPRLKKIMDKYDEGDPLYEMNFKKGQIELELTIDALMTYTLVFNYDAKLNTWILKKRISYVGYKNETTEYDIEPEKQIPIEKFDYMDWL